jgi:hypothetical protein
MTNNETSQPFEPFRVQSPLLQNAAPSSGAGRAAAVGARRPARAGLRHSEDSIGTKRGGS